MKFWISLLFILAPAFSIAEQCEPRVESCGYYVCEERNHHCGSKGYPLGFGFKFCQKFLKTEGKYSPQAQAWFHRVRVCLMSSLQKISSRDGLTCGELKKEAFHSHVDCYVNTGFCKLSGRDQLQISWAMRSSFLILDIIKDVFQVNRECVRRARNLEAPIELQ